jgi:hypothetical protein
MENKELELRKGQKAYLQSLVNNFKEDSTKAILELDALKNKIINGKEDEQPLFELIEDVRKEISEKKDEIQNLYDVFFKEDSNGLNFSDELNNIKDEFESKKELVISAYSEIENFKIKLTGEVNEDGSIKKKGIKHFFNDHIKEISDLYNTNSERQEALFKKIEGLLKGASTVALASSFNEHKKSFNLMNFVWLIVFIISVASMMLLSLWAFQKSNHKLQELWKYTLGNLPFLGGSIWLAIFASKQRSQNIRLQQEYAYKEDVAKVFYGLKQEIEELDDSELAIRLNEQILTVILDTVAYNPSETLESNSHNDKGPLLETLKSIANSINDIKLK